MFHRHLVLSLSVALAACSSTKDGAEDTDASSDTDVAGDTDVVDNTIVGIASSTPRFSILVDAVTKAGLAGALDGVTVFAPNNDAFQAVFAALHISGVADLTAEQLTVILKYHVVAGSVDSTAAIAAANGAGAVDALGGSLALSLDGADLKVDGATVITPDIIASNGIIHEIDSVLVPNIVDVVTTDPDLTILTSALLAADGDASSPDLVGTLSGAGPFTVLAPVNSGFVDLLSANGLSDLGGLVGAVGMPAVINVLLYHVAPGAVASPAVVAAGYIDTLGGRVTATVDGDMVTLNQGVPGLPGTNDSVVQVVDLVTSNGLIHKISKVVSPNSN